MKILTSRGLNFVGNNQGGALIVSIIVAALFSFILSAYLLWVGNHFKAANRSQAWNTAMPVMESGIEEAMAHINHKVFGTPVSEVMTRWQQDGGWTYRNNGLQAPRRHLSNGYYDVRVTTNFYGAKYPVIVSVGYALDNNLGTNYVARQVRVHTRRTEMYEFGMLGKNGVTFKGKVLADSFNSSEPSQSWYGMYDRRWNTDETSVASIDGDVNIGAQGKVYGKVYTSPTFTAENGSVGDKPWVDGENRGIKPGHHQKDLNTEMSVVLAPPGSPYAGPYPGTATVTNEVLTAARIVSDVYPDPPPPGGVLTNETALVTSAVYPTDISPSLIQTNPTTFVSTTLPNPPPSNFQIISTNITYSTSQSLTSLPPGSSFVRHELAGISEWRTNAPPAGTFAGTFFSSGFTNLNSRPIPGSGGRRETNWAYAKITGYTYAIPAAYTWTDFTYTYPTLAYIYNGAVTNTTIVTRFYKYILDTTANGYYEMNSLSMSGNEQILVRGHAVLWITRNFSMSGNSMINILPGASLRIYIGEETDTGTPASVSLQGNGILNQNKAANLEILGLPTCNNIQFGGNAAFTGTVYAPNARFRAVGGGKSTYDIVGAIAAQSIEFTGNFQMHYDTALANSGRIGGYMMLSWYEERVGTP